MAEHRDLYAALAMRQRRKADRTSDDELPVR
jgi:hypothetical protein